VPQPPLIPSPLFVAVISPKLVVPVHVESVFDVRVEVVIGQAIDFDARPRFAVALVCIVIVTARLPHRLETFAGKNEACSAAQGFVVFPRHFGVAAALGRPIRIVDAEGFSWEGFWSNGNGAALGLRSSPAAGHVLAVHPGLYNKGSANTTPLGELTLDRAAPGSDKLQPICAREADRRGHGRIERPTAGREGRLRRSPGAGGPRKLHGGEALLFSPNNIFFHRQVTSG
jgi:hypothetical protein